MGEFRVHHVQFFDYVPDAIHCIAYEESSRRLAVSRSTGSIDICSVPDNFYTEKTIHTSPGQSVEGLVWCGKRLFSAGLHGNLQEYDLVTLTVKCTVSANAGAIWCLTTNDTKSCIAAGTEDGCVVLFEVTGEEVLYLRAFSRQEGRILSIAWNSIEQRIVTGGVDNIRVWSVTSGQAIQRLTLGRTERNKETIVWVIGVTKDFTIVSGDSRGKTCFWNGRQGTLIRGFQSHKADVLALAVSEDGTSVYACGIDPTLVQFEFIATGPNSDWRSWVRSNVRKQHSHDVRALTFTDRHIVSAGVDTQIIYNHLVAEQGLRKWQRIHSTPQVSLVYLAKVANLVMFRYPDYLEVWKLGTTHHTSAENGKSLPLQNDPVRLLQLKSKGGEQIVSAAISDDGQWIAYSDVYNIRLFHICLEEEDLIVPKLTVNKVRYQPPDVLPARCLCFTPGGVNLIAATTSGTVQVLRTDTVRPKLVHTVRQPEGQPPVGIHLLEVSPDGRYAATADHNHNVNVYKITECKLMCTLPSYKFKPTAIAFHHTLPEIVVAYSDQRIFEYNIEQGEYTLWSRQFGNCLNSSWMKRPNKLVRVAYVPNNPSQILVGDDQMFCLIDKTHPFPSADEKLFVAKLSHKEQLKTKHCFHICNKFKHLIGVATMSEDFLLVVEQPPGAMKEHLPQAMHIKKFGT